MRKQKRRTLQALLRLDWNLLPGPPGVYVRHRYHNDHKRITFVSGAACARHVQMEWV
jgi:hypothetical protein